MRAISILRLDCSQRDTSLVIDLVFKLAPIKVVSQHVLVKLFFDNKMIRSFTLKVSRHFAQREMQIQPVVSMERVRSGVHTVKTALSRTLPPSDEMVEKKTKIHYDAKIEMLLSEDSPQVVSTGKLSTIDVVNEQAKKLFGRMEERRRKELVQWREH